MREQFKILDWRAQNLMRGDKKKKINKKENIVSDKQTVILSTQHDTSKAIANRRVWPSKKSACTTRVL
jgi:hypothetical protein